MISRLSAVGGFILIGLGTSLGRIAADQHGFKEICRAKDKTGSRNMETFSKLFHKRTKRRRGFHGALGA